MPKVKDTQRVEVGVESTWGTAVAGGNRIGSFSELVMEPLVSSSGFSSTAGPLPLHDARLDTVSALVNASGFLDYSVFHLWLNSLIYASTKSGGTVDWLVPETTYPARSSYTVIYGDANESYSALGAMVSAITLSADPPGSVNLDLEFLGSMADTDAIDSVSYLSAIAPAETSQVSVYIDAAGAGDNYGTTEVINQCAGLSLLLENGLEIVHSVSQRHGADFRHRGWDGELELDLMIGEFADYLLDQDGDFLIQGSTLLDQDDGSNVAEILFAPVLGTAPDMPKKQVRLVFSDGTNSSTMDLSVYLSEAPQIWEDVDGRAIARLIFRFIYDSSISSFARISLTNNYSTT